VRLAQFPGYAPDLNPLDRGLWQHRKRVERATVCRTNPQHLRQELRTAAARVRHTQRILHGCIRHADYRL
jgi:hypothetical protein